MNAVAHIRELKCSKWLLSMANVEFRLFVFCFVNGIANFPSNNFNYLYVQYSILRSEWTVQQLKTQWTFFARKNCLRLNLNKWDFVLNRWNNESMNDNVKTFLYFHPKLYWWRKCIFNRFEYVQTCTVVRSSDFRS